MANETKTDPDLPQTEDEMIRAMDAMEQQALDRLGKAQDVEQEPPPETLTDTEPATEPEVESDQVDDEAQDHRDPTNRRVNALLSKNKELEDKRAALEAEVAELRGKARSSDTQEQILREAEADPALKGIDPKTLMAAGLIADKIVGQRLAEIGVDKLQSLAAEHAIERELGIKLDNRQLSLVVETQRKHGVSPKEALLLTELRNPSAFPQRDQRGANRSHLSARPSGAGSLPKQENEVAKLLQQAAKARLGSDRDAALADAMNANFDRNAARAKTRR